MCFSFGLSINDNIIKIYHYKDVELFCYDLIDIALKSSWCISQSKRYYLILKVAIVGSEGCFLFITFYDPHLMISIGLIELDKPQVRPS